MNQISRSHEHKEDMKIVEHLIIFFMLKFFSMTDARTNFKNILDKSL